MQSTLEQIIGSGKSNEMREATPAVPLLEFIYKNAPFTVQVERRPRVNRGDKSDFPIVKFSVIDKDGVPRGKIIGELKRDPRDQSLTFKSSYLKNDQVQEEFMRVEKAPGHIGGIMRETIAQLLLQGAVGTWISTSGVLLEGGNKTYEALLVDPRLTGEKKLLSEKDSDENDRFQYKLTKKP
ncbi:MAG TPA: hypothetical protein VLH19_02030 [Patescibacteria group bacterium]|nr:hypothetical protein [Patescibacteria group bacterium]